MSDDIKTPERPICQYCGKTPRSTIKNHLKHCTEKPKNPVGRPKGAGKGSTKVAGSGRKKGKRNETTLTAKQSIQQVFEKLGGVEAMTAWAVRNQTEFYTKVYPKILPLDANLKHNMDQIPGLEIHLTHDPNKTNKNKKEDDS